MTDDHQKFQSTPDSDLEFEDHGFDLSRRLYTKSGKCVRIISTNGPGLAPIIGLIGPRYSGPQTGNIHRWDMHGKSYVGYACNKNVAHEDLVKNAVGEFDWDRPFKCRNDRSARLVASDVFGERPYLCLVRLVDREMPVLYYPNGKTDYTMSDNGVDLVNY
jgi:hypothetical protein